MIIYSHSRVIVELIHSLLFSCNHKSNHNCQEWTEVVVIYDIHNPIKLIHKPQEPHEITLLNMVAFRISFEKFKELFAFGFFNFAFEKACGIHVIVFYDGSHCYVSHDNSHQVT